MEEFRITGSLRTCLLLLEKFLDFEDDRGLRFLTGESFGEPSVGAYRWGRLDISWLIKGMRLGFRRRSSMMGERVAVYFPLLRRPMFDNSSS